MDISTTHGTHLPVLIKVINITNGPVLELGMGIFSTPYLHFACYPRRRLVSFENNSEFSEWITAFKSGCHETNFVDDWNKINISGHWSVALIDHSPAERRIEEIKRLSNSCDYLVVHDTNPRQTHKYHYNEIYPLFKFRKDFTREKPYTAVLSNFYDLSNL